MAHAPAQFFGSPTPGATGRGQKFNFLNMVMWHIKLKGMSIFKVVVVLPRMFVKVNPCKFIIQCIKN